MESERAKVKSVGRGVLAASLKAVTEEIVEASVS